MGLSIKQKQEILFDDSVKQHGIMGVVVFTTIAKENLPDMTQMENNG